MFHQPWNFPSKDIIRNFTDGVAVHWYWDQLVESSVLDDFHQKYPNQIIISSEACLGDFTPGPEVAFESVWYHAGIRLENITFAKSISD